MNEQMKLSDWKVDNSAGRPILTYKGCSVIEAEDAEFVLSAIKAALPAPVLNVPEQAPALTSHEIDFCLLVLQSPGARLDDEGQARHWEDDGSEYGQIFSHWYKPEELGLIECVGGYKWVPTDKLKSMVRAALAGPQQPAPKASPIEEFAEMLDALENARELLEYGGFDLEKIDRAISNGRTIASAVATAARQLTDLGPLEIRLQKLITENPEKARLASSREDLRMWFVAELISEASGRIPLLEIEGLVSRHLAAGKGGDP